MTTKNVKQIEQVKLIDTFFDKYGKIQKINQGTIDKLIQIPVVLEKYYGELLCLSFDTNLTFEHVLKQKGILSENGCLLVLKKIIGGNMEPISKTKLIKNLFDYYPPNSSILINTMIYCDKCHRSMIPLSLIELVAEWILKLTCDEESEESEDEKEKKTENSEFEYLEPDSELEGSVYIEKNYEKLKTINAIRKIQMDANIDKEHWINRSDYPTLMLKKITKKYICAEELKLFLDTYDIPECFWSILDEVVSHIPSIVSCIRHPKVTNIPFYFFSNSRYENYQILIEAIKAKKVEINLIDKYHVDLLASMSKNYAIYFIKNMKEFHPEGIKP